MLRVLVSKNKLRFVDGSLTQPVDNYNPTFEVWGQYNNLVHSGILNSVSPTVFQSIVYGENALKLKGKYGEVCSIVSTKHY